MAYTMNVLFDHDLQDAVDGLMERIREWPAFYASLDIDIVDPAYAPGVDVPEPGGLSSRELLYMIQRIQRINKPRMIDIVEVNPLKDRDEMTVRLAAKIVQECS